MKHLLFFILAFSVFSCSTREKRITKPEDYNKFLSGAPIPTSSKYFELWNAKIKPDSLQLMSFGIVAGEYTRYFMQNGDIEQLKNAEKALKKAVEIGGVNRAGYLRSLARNYISQHKFEEALPLALKAKSLGSGARDTQMLLFDIHMELGNYAKAEAYLDDFYKDNDFGSYIRKAKFRDHEGKLEVAINYMELAKAIADHSKNPELQQWTYTNLADFYGHAGKIEASYQHYLKTLAIDPQNAYAKKGIAWIVFAREKNPEEALRILDSVWEYHKSPDYLLLKMEIAAYMNDDLMKEQNLTSYFEMLKNLSYGVMYNTHNLECYLEETNQPEEALRLAEEEVRSRPTPESYGWLAYSYLKLGEKEKAIEVVEEHIAGKTSEPVVLLQLAEIYKANDRLDEVYLLKKELLEATYELGPLKEQQILAL
ncbi:tetratricopeptide repeat protein [Spongiimicrobium salis]|uniref:tetratricopeptide repeat protein n=1 Tax=Spongiimicrobium salis TaxID=1667022 RepID=UPI00374DA1DB